MPQLLPPRRLRVNLTGIRCNIAGATRQRGPVREQMYVPRDMAYALNQFKDLGLKRYGADIVDVVQQAKNIQTGMDSGRAVLARGYHDR